MQDYQIEYKRILRMLLFSLVAISMIGYLFSCSDTVDDEDIVYSELTDTNDWSEITHEKLTNTEIISNTSTVFDSSKVQKMRVIIESENWSFMNKNLDNLKEELGGSIDFNTVDNPTFVPCELFYSVDGTDTNELEWYKVGVRFKGNSSLYNANSNKLSFKLDFDEFEDIYQEVDNQRFYGFKQINLKSNYNDESEMREIVGSELFCDFGLVGPHCSFYELYLNVDDSGEEANDIYYGLYTMVEEVDDTVIKTQYSNNSGNLYKPEDDAGHFSSGTYDEDEYGLQTDDDTTYDDIKELYNLINDSTRISAYSSWQTELEAIFDVDIFLKWLAANTVMQNWDTYGVMSHNYFIYNNPGSGKFEWIPWDNNEALDDNRRCLALDMSTVDSEWPLIKYLLDNSDYKTKYKTYIKSFADSFFNSTYMNGKYENYQTLIKPSVISEISGYTFTSESSFDDAVEYLKNHATSRNISANNYVD